MIQLELCALRAVLAAGKRCACTACARPVRGGVLLHRVARHSRVACVALSWYSGPRSSKDTSGAARSSPLPLPAPSTPLASCTLALVFSLDQMHEAGVPTLPRVPRVLLR
jgi:hypothetical protein